MSRRVYICYMLQLMRGRCTWWNLCRKCWSVLMSVSNCMCRQLSDRGGGFAEPAWGNVSDARQCHSGDFRRIGRPLNVLYSLVSTASWIGLFFKDSIVQQPASLAESPALIYFQTRILLLLYSMSFIHSYIYMIEGCSITFSDCSIWTSLLGNYFICTQHMVFEL